MDLKGMRHEVKICMHRPNTEVFGEPVQMAMLISVAEEKGISFSLKQFNEK